MGKGNSGQRKEIVVILATGHENTSHLRIDLLYEWAGLVKPDLNLIHNIAWQSCKS